MLRWKNTIPIRLINVRHLLAVIFTGLLISSPAFAQDETKPVTGDVDLSYFSQEEMDFVMGKKNQPWNYGRLTIMTVYAPILPNWEQYIPYQLGFLMSFDHGTHHLFKPYYRKKSPLIPGFRAEFGYNIYGQNNLGGVSATAGLLWMIPIGEDQALKVVVGGQGGMVFLRGVLGSTEFSNDAGVIVGLIGVEYSFSNIFLSLTGRFNYILDNNMPMMSAGGSLGVGFQFDASRNSTGEGK
jgi:hypothetical protein